MKTKENNIKERTFVQQMRNIRDKVDDDIKDLNFEQLKKYINKHKALHKGLSDFKAQAK